MDKTLLVMYNLYNGRFFKLLDCFKFNLQFFLGNSMKNLIFIICACLSFSLSLILSNGYCAEKDLAENSNEQFLQTLENSSEFLIAVLPMENLSVDSTVAYHFRQRIIERLHAKGYTTVDQKLLDESLHAAGISHAGQLRLLTFEKLAGITHANGFLSGVVEQAATQHAAVYNAFVYTCSMKLQDRKGEVLWSSLQNRVAKRRFAIDPINALLDIALVEGKSDMQQASYALANQMLATLPVGPVKIVVGDSLLDMATEISVKQKP